ncbi:sorting nexin-16-like isoform X2 [Neoarius graeffei]|uniref:sorting nexin-16-like isoform X2 n=1 Tax=Neoarius graeffei TaxID=443677 RepID=UPI00298C1613|nr:sorting nexin-16-like isoform X2 [Neoarius graeffei]
MEGSVAGHATHLHRRTSSLGCLSDHVSKENMTRTRTEEWHDRPPVPTLLGYEVMEERAKFTVYKILVRRAPDESWVIFRRYTDFSRLNNKLKEMFPKSNLCLPPKRRFKDNYDMNFLEDRQAGLQAFLQNLVAQKDMTKRNCSRFYSSHIPQAYCETLEETNHRLQRELQDKQREILSLRRILEDRELQICRLEKTKNSICDELSEVCTVCSETLKVDAHTELEIEAARTDDANNPDSRLELQLAKRSHAACWSGSASQDSERVSFPRSTYLKDQAENFHPLRSGMIYLDSWK